MCGFVGFLDLRRATAEAELRRIVQRMARELEHRGPDDAGIWCDPISGVALGHRRLSIIDLSPLGHQPMQSPSGRTLVFNGEIYNFQELRQELETLGHVFRGRSDTEVILASIDQWGVHGALGRFNGMFAFALWTPSDRSLILARDRFGEKPLYFGKHGSIVLFASELKAFCGHPSWMPEIDRGALRDYLRFGYVPGPDSIFSGIQKLKPGTWLRIVDGADIVRSPTPFWSLLDVARRGVSDPFRGTEQEALEELERRVHEAVRLRMVADVPLGAFLSGGIDSSTVVALMQAQSTRPVQTFTIGFEDPRYNEADAARAVAAHLGTRHTELLVTAEQALAVIPKLPTLYDEPFADSSQIPTFLVSQLARRQVTVALSGDGGDELFGGYTRYSWAETLWRLLSVLPRDTREPLAAAIQRLNPSARDDDLNRLFARLPKRFRLRNAGSKLLRLAEMLPVAKEPSDLYLQLISNWKTPESLVLGHPGIARPLPWAEFDVMTLAMMYADSVSYLPDDILVKLDRATMAVSLEGRVPLLDARLVEFAWQLPTELKVRAKKGKWLLRRLLAKYVPTALFERPKAGFSVPIDVWLRGPLRDWAEAQLSVQRLKRDGYLDASPIRQRWEEHRDGKRNWQASLWAVLMFQVWLDKWHVDSNGRGDESLAAGAVA